MPRLCTLRGFVILLEACWQFRMILRGYIYIIPFIVIFAVHSYSDISKFGKVSKLLLSKEKMNCENISLFLKALINSESTWPGLTIN